MNRFKYFIFFTFIFLFGIAGGKAYSVPSGNYKIASALDNNKVINVVNNNFNNGTNVVLKDFENYNAIWKVTHLGNDYYSITLDNMSLDVSGASKKNGANVQLYDVNNTDAQKWLIKSAGNGYYYILSKCNGLYVDVASASTANGTNIWMYKGNNTDAQKFKFVEVLEGSKTIDNGTYLINSKLNSYSAISTEANQDNVSLNRTNSGYNEAFNIKYLNDGYYEISSYNNDKLLSTPNDILRDGSNVSVSNKNNSNAQKWIIKENDDGTYNIVSAIDHYYLDIAGGKSEVGTNVQIYSGNNTEAQKFTFTKIDYTKIEDGFYNILASSDLALTLNNEVVVNGGNIQLASKNDNNNQKWYIKNIKDNIYEISSAIDNDYVFDVTGGSTNNKTNIQTYQTNGTDAQRWVIVKLSNGDYRFTNVNSGKNLDVSNGSIKSGSNIQQYDNNDTDAQKFKIESTEKSSYNQIINNDNYILYSAINLNKSLRTNKNVYINDVEGIDTEIIAVEYVGNGFYILKNNDKVFTNNSGKIEMKEYQNLNTQKWFAIKAGDYYTFISKSDGKALDLSRANVTNGNSLQTYTSNNTSAQKFYLEAVSDNDLDTGYYTFSSDNKLVGLSTEFAYNGSVPILSDSNNINTQKWYFKKLGSNLYEIKYALNPNKVLDVASAKTADGTTVQVYTSNSSNAQRWHIIKLKDGNYKFISHLSHTCVTIDNNKTRIYSNNKDKIQKFKLSATDGVTVGMSVNEGYYIISSFLNSNKVLDVKGSVMKSGTNVQLYSSNSTVAQIWKLKYIDNGLYYIISALNPKRALSNINGNVQINKFTESENQKWYIKAFENDKVAIVSGSDSLYVDVSGANTADGTNIGVYQGNDTNAQRFILKPYGTTKTYRGIDISKWQGVIDWDKLENINLQFVIMRAGFGKYVEQKDGMFENYYSNAVNRDIPIGVYTYSYAKNVADSQKEAEVTVEWLKGKKIDLPVFYDIEEKYMTSYSKDQLTSMVRTFCETITNRGYKCGVYSYRDFLINNIDTKSLATKYPIWVAHYTGPDDYNTILNNLNRYKTNYNYTPFSYWQFSSLGSISGVDTAVDLDFGYNIYD